MFCTSKERETCDVEKMTCDGCYYNKDGDYMDEEMIEKAIKLSKSYTDNYYTDKFRLEAFRLKNELEQEKEKNKKLEEVIKLMANDI